LRLKGAAMAELERASIMVATEDFIVDDGFRREVLSREIVRISMYTNRFLVLIDDERRGFEGVFISFLAGHFIRIDDLHQS
jgi:hypothetical protein